MTQRAVCYIRTTRHEQEEGLTQKTQEMALQGYCAMKQIQIHQMIHDEDTPANTPLESREGGQTLSRLLDEARDIDTVVVYALDRMFRHAQDCLKWINRWHERGIAVHVLQVGDQSIHTGSSVGPLLLSLLSGIAQIEQTIATEKSIDANDGPAIKPVRYTGAAPYGFQLDEHGIHLLEEATEQRALRRIWELHQEGYSIRKISKILEIESHPARGNRWHPTTISRLIRRLTEAED